MADCAFCRVQADHASIVYADHQVVAFLDRSPVQLGHVLLIPREHVVTYMDLPPGLLSHFFAVGQRIAAAMESALDAEGSFVAMNNRVSQSVPHLHMHIVPRRKGDGLKGFFWPRKKYAGADEMSLFAERLRVALARKGR